jgi:hypothetical protein
VLYRSPQAYVQANTVLYGCMSPDPPPNEAMQVEGEIATPKTPVRQEGKHKVQIIVKLLSQKTDMSVHPWFPIAHCQSRAGWCYFTINPQSQRSGDNRYHIHI